MSLLNTIDKKKKMPKIDKDSTVIQLDDDKIPYDKIKNENKITFIVASKDEKVIEKTLQAIVDLNKEHKELDITVIISSSYEKLHELTNGAL